MKVSLTARNQITIPKQLVSKLNLKPGQSFDIEETKNGLSLVLTESITKEQKSATIKSKSVIVKPRKIYVSKCELVTRTNKSYIDKMCSKCKGKLVLTQNNNQHSCKYIAKGKSLLPEISNNVQKLQKKIETDINRIEKEYP